MAGLYEPSPSYAPSYSIVNRELCLWGGKVTPTNSLKIYNPFLESWRKRAIRGPKPSGLYGGACAHSSHYLFIYGGIKTSGSLSGDLHRLDMLDKSGFPTWIKVQSHSDDGPMKKAKCGMIVHENSVVLIGGYGIRNNLRESDSGWAKEKAGDADGDCSARGYTNEIHTYNEKESNEEEKKWFPLKCTGTGPPPCSDFSLTMLDLHQVLLFGGIQKGSDGNGAYILDLLSREWTKLSIHDVNSVMVRYSHTAVCMDYCGEQPQLLIVGGRTAHAILNDAWLLDIKSGSLESISLPQFQARHSHCAAAFTVSPGILEVVIFGGSRATGSVNADKFVADTNVLRFQKDIFDSKAKWFLTDKANKFQRGITKRIREKITKLSLSADEIYWHMKEARKCQSEAETELLRLQKINDDLQKKVKKLEEQELSWIVHRKEIVVTDKTVGSGAWAKVNVAEFRGQRVAAKILHKRLDHESVRSLIKREMKIASRVRCPNLVQFIAASMDIELIILMELLHTSLRELFDDPIAQTSTFHLSVSMDVAKALNYLHLMQPPIFHRDISSANVLLEPLANQQWRAKVSDYGSSNIKHETSTSNPGAPAYSAPEACDPDLHTAEMDIFSYGVLLVEICTSHFPLQKERDALILSIQESHWVDLIRECLKIDPTHRPPACQIISKLQSWQTPQE